MTYSIVARDPDTGEMGVAVQSHWFSVGSVVPWAEAGVGAIATQAFAEPSYGPLGLGLLRGGKNASDALRALVSVDPGADRRQVAVVDAQGRIDVHTGEGCLAEAGHLAGEGYCCQANMMLHSTVPDAMSRAYEGTTGELTDRLLAALDAAEDEGGDIRGRQSAAILVVRGEPSGNPYADRVCELRVEDHHEPLRELRRLVGVYRAYGLMNAADGRVASGDLEGAAELFGQAQRAAPDNAEFTFWHAVMVANAGHVDEARKIFAQLHDAPGEWAELLRRLPAGGLIPEEVVRRVLEAHT